MSPFTLLLLCSTAISHTAATVICGIGQQCGVGAACECWQWVSECNGSSCQMTPLGVGLFTVAVFIILVIVLACCGLLYCCFRPCEGCCSRSAAPIAATVTPNVTNIHIPLPYDYHHSSAAL